MSSRDSMNRTRNRPGRKRQPNHLAKRRHGRISISRGRTSKTSKKSQVRTKRKRRALSSIRKNLWSLRQVVSSYQVS